MKQKLLEFCYQLNWYFCVISKCFYSSEEGKVDSCMAWYGWLQESFSSCSTFLSLFWSSDLCFSVWLSCITRLNVSVLFQPARDATHKMSFTDLNTVLLCLLVDVVNRWLVLNHLYVSVFSVQINLSEVHRTCWTEVVCTNWQLCFFGVIQLHLNLKRLLDPRSTSFFFFFLINCRCEYRSLCVLQKMQLIG